MSETIRVATVNLLNDSTRWAERKSLLVAQLKSRSLDLIGLQEVTNPLGDSTAHQLARELGDYSVWVSPKTGRAGRHEGIAILSRLPVESHETLDLQGQGRTAQLVRVAWGTRTFVFLNGHYYWWPTAHEARAKQVDLVRNWRDAAAPGLPAILCGDFNATPESLAFSRVKESYHSAYAIKHGREPDATFPTPLRHGSPIRRLITNAALRLFTNRPGEMWRGTLDYLFVSGEFRVIDCDVFLNEASPLDPTLYPSDHFGLAADLGFRE